MKPPANHHKLVPILGLLAALPVGALAQYSSPPPPPPPPPSQEAPPPPEAPPPAPSAAPAGSVEMPAGLSPGDVRRAILAALHHRGWTVESVQPGSIVAHLLHHHVDATLTLQYGPARVDIYAESYLVGHHAEDRIVPFVRGDWIRNLEHDIPRYVGGR